MSRDNELGRLEQPREGRGQQFEATRLWSKIPRISWR